MREDHHIEGIEHVTVLNNDTNVFFLGPEVVFLTPEEKKRPYLLLKRLRKYPYQLVFDTSPSSYSNIRQLLINATFKMFQSSNFSHPEATHMLDNVSKSKLPYRTNVVFQQPLNEPVCCSQLALVHGTGHSLEQLGISPQEEGYMSFAEMSEDMLKGASTTLLGKAFRLQKLPKPLPLPRLPPPLPLTVDASAHLWAVGDAVDAQWGDGRARWGVNGKWHAAKVTRCNCNKTYDVHYDDGDSETGVEEAYVRARKCQKLSR